VPDLGAKTPIHTGIEWLHVGNCVSAAKLQVDDMIDIAAGWNRPARTPVAGRRRRARTPWIMNDNGITV
jgi:hypothetical protein